MSPYKIVLSPALQHFRYSVEWLSVICCIYNQIKYCHSSGMGWSILPRAYHFRNSRHVCGINQKEHIFVSLGEIEDETSLNSMQIESFLGKKVSKKIR